MINYIVVGKKKDCGIGVLLDTDVFVGLHPRDWGKALATVQLSELLDTSKYDNPTDEHTHQWLDENGWEHRTTYVQDTKGKIYEAKLSIADGVDRKILYEINNITLIDKNRTGRAVVPSDANTQKGLGHNTSSSDTISKNNNSVKIFSDEDHGNSIYFLGSVKSC